MVPRLAWPWDWDFPKVWVIQVEVLCLFKGRAAEHIRCCLGRSSVWAHMVHQFEVAVCVFLSCVCCCMVCFEAVHVLLHILHFEHHILYGFGLVIFIIVGFSEWVVYITSGWFHVDWYLFFLERKIGPVILIGP